MTNGAWHGSLLMLVSAGGGFACYALCWTFGGSQGTGSFFAVSHMHIRTVANIQDAGVVDQA